MAKHYPCGHPCATANTRLKKNGSGDWKPACRKCFNKYQRLYLRRQRKAAK